jgi:hypothetical protein
MLSDRADSYVSSIDGLRAVAVLTVMAYHLNRTFLPGGFVGVDIFFVISGFVVTLSIYKRRFENLPKLFCYFYAKIDSNRPPLDRYVVSHIPGDGLIYSHLLVEPGE